MVQGLRRIDCLLVFLAQRVDGCLNGERNVTDVSDDSLLSILKQSVDIFRRKRVSYVLIGAWTLAVWGKPRATLDLDFMVKVDEEESLRKQ